MSDSWRVFLLCGSRHEGEPCNHRDHVASAKKRQADVVAAPTLLEAARIAHYMCDVWAQASHGGVYVRMAEEYCGLEALRHIVCIANKPWLIDMWLAARQSDGTLFDMKEAA